MADIPPPPPGFVTTPTVEAALPPPPAGFVPIGEKPSVGVGDVLDVAGQAARALPGSLWEQTKKAATGLYETVTDPVGTAQQLYELGKSTAATLGPRGKATGVEKVALPSGQFIYRPTLEETPEERAQREQKSELAKSVWGEVSRPYSSWEAARETLTTDPARYLFDLGSIFPSKAAAAVSFLPKAAAKGAGTVGLHTLAHMSGAGPEALKQATRAGYERATEFIDFLKSKRPITEIVDLAEKGLGGMANDRNRAYQAGIGVIHNDPRVIPFKDVLDTARNAFQKETYYGEVLRAPPEPGTIQNINNILVEWGMKNPDVFHSPAGLDALNKKLKDIGRNIPFDQKSSRAYVNSITKELNNLIETRAPGYKEVMKDYRVATDAMDEMKRALSLGNNKTYDTSLRKLLSAFRHNATTNFENRLRMVEELEKAGAKGLPSAIAGAHLAAPYPRGLAKLASQMFGMEATADPAKFSALALAAPLYSPYMQGLGAYGLGTGARYISDLAKTVLPEAARPATTEAIRTLLRTSPQIGTILEEQPPQQP